MTAGQRVFGVTTVVGMALAGAVVVAGNSSAETPSLRDGFAPSGNWAWYNDVKLGTTSSPNQYAQAKVSGLEDGDHNAGFFLRYASKRSRVLVAVSGDGWRIEPQNGTIKTGEFKHSSSGLFRAEIKDKTVRVLWNGGLITTQKIDGIATGTSVIPSVWQSSPTVKMTALEASSLGRPSELAGIEPTPSLLSSSAAPTTTSASTSSSPSTSTSSPSTSSPSTSSPSTSSPSTSTSSSSSTSTSPSSSTSSQEHNSSGETSWLSGASGDRMASGGFDNWRGTASGIAGSWDDNADAQMELWSICGGQYSKWNKALDLAVGGIYLDQGQSWAAAARGDYNDRWTKILTKAKQCWGSRDPGKLFIRFAHEMNLPNEWRVRGGQEGDFVRAITQFSDIRYQVFPGAKIVLCPNDGTDGGLGGLDIRKLWPGKDSRGRQVADVYAVDSYNAWPHTTTVDSFNKKINETADDGSPVGIEKHRQFAEIKGVPFGIGEWSNNGDPGDADGGGESTQFVKSFYQWAKSHGGDVDHPRPGQLLYEVQFNLWNQYEFWPDTMQPQTASAYRQLHWGS